MDGMRRYAVKPGDTLPGISRKFYGAPDWAMVIWEHNRHYVLNPNQLAPGQVIVIPHLPVHAAAEHAVRRLLA